MYRRYRKIFLLVAMFLLFTENPSVFAQINNAQFLYQTFPSAMIVGQSYPVSITMKNTGTTSWIQSADYKLGSQNPQDNVIWGISRVTLAPGEVIAPGEQKTFIFYVQAPLTPDIYNFQWRMVDLVGWFGDFTLNVTITVTQPSIVVSVKDFGAEGDGITDDAPAIQNAIDSLPPTGGAVYAPAGTYMLGTSAGGVEPYPDGSLIQSALIINKNNVIFGGEGTQTILKLMPHTKMRVISVTSQRVTVEKILVDGNKAERNGTVPWPYGDVVDGLVYGSSMSSYMTIRHCEVKNGIEGGLGSWLSSYVYIHDNFVHDNGTPQAGGEGMSIAGTGNVGGRLINNVFSNNTSAGLRLTGSSDVHIEGNLIEKNSGPGIGTGGDSPQSTVLSSDIRIANNTIRNNGSTGFPGVMIYSAQDGTIASNLIINNTYDGLQFDDQGSIPSSNWIVQNNISSNTNPMRDQTFGIRVLGLSNDIILQANECRDNGTSIDHQIVVQNESAVNADWRTVNIIGFTPPKRSADFDGNGKTDIAFYRASTGVWWINPSSGAAAYGHGWGGPGFKPVPGDYDGDGKTDIAIYDITGGAWWIIPSSGASAYGVGWGGSAFKPIPGDYDGDGKTDIAIYHASTGGWWIIPSSGTGPQGQVGAYGVGWGGSDFKPVPGDYDGDGKTDIAIYDITGGAWWIIPSSVTPAYGIGWGGSAFKPVPGDYDGDGKADIAIYHTTNGGWWIIPSSGTGPQGQVGAYGVGWGGSEFTPVPGDYDGDGKTDVAIYQPSNGGWWIIYSSDGSTYGMGWGGDASDIPLTTNPD